MRPKKARPELTGLNGARSLDGAILSQWKVEQGHLVRKQTQPTEDLLLDSNAELRKNPGALRPLSFMGLELRIPELHYLRLVKKYPDLNSPDGLTRRNAWRKFMASAEADPYRVHDRVRVRG